MTFIHQYLVNTADTEIICLVENTQDTAKLAFIMGFKVELASIQQFS